MAAGITTAECENLVLMRCQNYAPIISSDNESYGITSNLTANLTDCVGVSENVYPIAADAKMCIRDREKEVLADCRSVVLAANTVGSEVYSGKTAYRPRTQVQELSGVKQNPDVGSDTGCVVEYDSQCNVIGVACWTGDITACLLYTS